MTATALLNNRYQLIADLNKGSYGVVSLAMDVGNDNALCAIKCIVRSSSHDYDEALQEISMHQKLGCHKNIAKMIDHFEGEDQKMCLVMEYYANGDLYEAIKAGRGPREQGMILEFMTQLIDAVRYCHSRGIYHRDIKPENILIANDGTVKLADWGLATVDKHCKDFGAGSERYMAPELFDHANFDSYDAEMADIWSVGIVLLNILFGRNPFTVASQKDKLFLDFAMSREALFDIFPTLSGDVFAVLRYALTLDPDNRSLEKMSIELRNVQVWTTDEEFYGYDEVTEDLSAAAPITADNVDDIVTTTDDRQPFRTPSAFVDVTNPQSFVSNTMWDRTMQFTPPTKERGFPRHVVKGPSGLSQIYSHGSITEEDEDEDVVGRGDASSDEDVFAMDSLSNSIDKISLNKERNGSGSDASVSSVPSLVQSTVSSSAGPNSRLLLNYSSSLSKSLMRTQQQPASSTPIRVQGKENTNIKIASSLPNHRDYFKFGKSWSDIDCEDDDDDFEDERFYEFLKQTLPPGAAKLKTQSEAVSTPSIARHTDIAQW